MDDNVPLPIIGCEVLHIPPVFIEFSISIPEDLREDVEPGVEDSIEHNHQADHSTDSGGHCGMNEFSQAYRFLMELLDHRDAKAFEDRPQVVNDQEEGDNVLQEEIGPDLPGPRE